MHGRLQTDRHSIGLSAISGSAARRSASAANSLAPSGPSSDLQVTQTRRVAGDSRSRRSSSGRLGSGHAYFERSDAAPRDILSRSADHSGHHRSLAAPPAASRNSSAHGRSPGSQRIADAAFPDFISPVARKASARRSQSRGRPRIGERPTVFPFHPLARSRDRAGLCSSFAGGCQMRDRSTAVIAPQFQLGRAQSQVLLPPDANDDCTHGAESPVLRRARWREPSSSKASSTVGLAADWTLLPMPLTQ